MASEMPLCRFLQDIQMNKNPCLKDLLVPERPVLDRGRKISPSFTNTPSLSENRRKHSISSSLAICSTSLRELLGDLRKDQVLHESSHSSRGLTTICPNANAVGIDRDRTRNDLDPWDFLFRCFLRYSDAVRRCLNAGFSGSCSVSWRTVLRCSVFCCVFTPVEHGELGE